MNAIVDSPPLAFLAGFVYLFSTCLVLWRSKQDNNFAYVVLSVEYFYIIGVGLGSLAMALEIGAQSEFFRSYIFKNGPINNLTFYHIIFFSVGMFFGAFFDDLFIRKCKSEIPLLKNENESDNFQLALFRLLLCCGLFILVAYTIVVGPVVALVTAAKARAGSTEGLENASQFVFLKNIAQIGAISVIFVAAVIEQKRYTKDVFLLSFYGISLYLITGSRSAIFDTIFLAFLIYFSRKNDGLLQTMRLYVPLLVAGLVFTVFGKGFGDSFFELIFEGKEYEHEKSGNILDSFFGQFSHLIYSIDAGVKNFIDTGPLISKAILLAPMGVMPGWLYTNFDIEFLSWQHLNQIENIVCVNTMRFPDAAPCTMPPYFTGVSAYVSPIVFGFAFGFIKFFTYAKISNLWKKFERSPHKLWLPLLLFYLSSRIFLFIPNVIGLHAFFGMVVLLVYCCFRFAVFVWGNLEKR